jgi:hypothetical protein
MSRIGELDQRRRPCEEPTTQTLISGNGPHSPIGWRTVNAIGVLRFFDFPIA